MSQNMQNPKTVLAVSANHQLAAIAVTVPVMTAAAIAIYIQSILLTLLIRIFVRRVVTTLRRHYMT